MQEMTCAQAAQAMLKVLGESGENWIKSAFHRGSAHCLLGAWQEAGRRHQQAEVLRMLDEGLSLSATVCVSTLEGAVSMLPWMYEQPGYATETRVHRELAQIIREQFPERTFMSPVLHPAAWTVFAFNDHADTIWADVRLVLDKLAAVEE